MRESAHGRGQRPAAREMGRGGLRLRRGMSSSASRHRASLDLSVDIFCMNPSAAFFLCFVSFKFPLEPPDPSTPIPIPIICPVQLWLTIESGLCGLSAALALPGLF